MNVSTIPVVLDTLAALWQTAVPALQVEQGGVLESENDLLIVGYDEEQQAAVTGSRSLGDFGGESNREIYDINNLLSVWSGDADTVGVRTRMFGYLNLLDGALTGNHELGILGVLRAAVTSFGFSQPISPEGSVATLRFVVSVDTFRQP